MVGSEARMRKISYLTVLALFFWPGLSAVVANAQQTDPPPVSAKKITRIHQGAVVTASMVKSRVQPKYPQEAKDKGISGAVKMHAIIARDGTVSQIEVISGDALLASAAADAVRQWKYRVTYLNGEPVEVDSTIDLIFALDR
jgi:periplasmic protein TonB